MKKLLLLMVICFYGNILKAQSYSKRLDSLFNRLEIHNKAMLSAAIFYKGELAYLNSIGFSSVENNSKANQETLYQIGSVSKMFTAVMIYQLFEEKKIHPNTSIQSFFPLLKNASQIRISHLLNHSSGIHNFTSDSAFQILKTQAVSEKNLIDYFYKMPADFEPGTQHAYSNTNYVLLSIIIEKLGRAPYAKQLQTRIVDKLGLKNTFYDMSASGMKTPTTSYSWENKSWKPESFTHSSVSRGAGNIVSTPSDLCVFINGLFSGKLLNSASLDSMKKITNEYGNGIFEMPFYDKISLGHTGGIDGFTAILGYFEKEKTAYCITSNAVNYPFNDIALGMLSIYFKKPCVISPIETPTEAVVNYKTIEGVYTNGKVGMSINIFFENGVLMAQATGQDAFPLTKVSDKEYGFAPASIVLLFNTDDKNNTSSFILNQQGIKTLFEK